MSDSDGPPQQDSRHHRRSPSRSPVSPGYAAETNAERKERPLAEAAVLVGPPAGRPQAAPNDPEPAAQEPPAGRGGRSHHSGRSPCRPAPGEGGGGFARGCCCRPGQPRRGPRHAAGTGNRPQAGPERVARGSCSRGGGQAGRQVRRPHGAQPHPHKAPQAAPAQGCLPRGEAAARPPPGAQAYVVGHHTAADAAAARLPARGPRGRRKEGGGRTQA